MLKIISMTLITLSFTGCTLITPLLSSPFGEEKSEEARKVQNSEEVKVSKEKETERNTTGIHTYQFPHLIIR